MSKKLLIALVAGLVGLSIALVGCKGRVDKAQEQALQPELEIAEQSLITTEEGMSTQPIEPAQTIAMETVPPTAASPAAALERPIAASVKMTREMDIQMALKSAGFYSGAIDGKIGPKTKKAIEEFQKANGLKADGKVGPKTWAVLEKYLAR